MDKNMLPIQTQGLDLPVATSMGDHEQNGIAFGTHNGRVLISIVKDGHGLSVWLGGDDIDLAAGMLAVAVEDATRAEAPSLRSVQ